MGMVAELETTKPDLSDRRRVQLDEMLREVRLFSKRADLPEDRMALAEIERELLDLEKRWLAAGKLDGQQDLPLPSAA